jgi:tRNA A37 threonylcarbamoyladenosine dehydratase
MCYIEDGRFERSRSLVGAGAFERLTTLHVAIFGVGGVGGWCAEALLRTGVRRLTLIDDDTVAESNINRQRQAMSSTIGKPKVDVLRNILREIIPEADITVIPKRYTPETSTDFDGILSDCHFVIDAIDSVDCKADLIQKCITRNLAILSSMGAALRTDPTKVRIAPFHKVAGDGLAKALRNRFRKSGVALPRHPCVYSEELPNGKPGEIKGSVMPVTCAFGMALASLVLQTVLDPT